MKKILIIEDDKNIRDNLFEILTNEGFEVIQTDNGKKGVELAKSELPTLILCDMQLPELNGLTILKLLKTSSATLKIPFIFISGFSDRNLVIEGITGGAVDYIVKPFQMDRLINTINKAIDNAVDRQ
ncbi:MAG: response regulator [Bacteroidota bacterium]|nr:response regulator [Bacteroidota bacterium]